MRILVTEATGIRHGATLFKYGEETHVPANLGEYFCSMGWATDLDGGVATGKRDTSPVTIIPHKANHTHAGDEVNG